jgi:hypothetical protein
MYVQSRIIIGDSSKILNYLNDLNYIAGNIFMVSMALKKLKQFAFKSINYYMFNGCI